MSLMLSSNDLAPQVKYYEGEKLKRTKKITVVYVVETMTQIWQKKKTVQNNLCELFRLSSTKSMPVLSFQMSQTIRKFMCQYFFQ